MDGFVNRQRLKPTMSVTDQPTVIIMAAYLCRRLSDQNISSGFVLVSQSVQLRGAVQCTVK